MWMEECFYLMQAATRTTFFPEVAEKIFVGAAMLHICEVRCREKKRDYAVLMCPIEITFVWLCDTLMFKEPLWQYNKKRPQYWSSQCHFKHILAPGIHSKEKMQLHLKQQPFQKGPVTLSLKQESD